MKVRISFYLVCVIFGLASSAVVPPNFKSPHDEHMHAEETLASTVPNAGIPILGNSESQNTSSTVLVDHHQLNISDVLIPDFHNVSDLNHVQNAVLGEDLAAKKLPKVSGRSKKKSQKDSSRFIKPSRRETDHVNMNDMQHHGSADDKSSESQHPETGPKTEDLKTHGSVHDHSLESHQKTHHKTEIFKFNSSANSNSSEHHHLETDHKTVDLNVQDSVDDHSFKPHHLETNHIAEDSKINVSLNDDSLEPHHQQMGHHKTEDVKIHISVDDHSPEPHHLELDHKTDNLGFHDTVEDHFSELDHAPANFSHTDKNVSKSVKVENATAHFDEKPGLSKNFATTSDDMLKIPINELSRKEKDFLIEEIENKNHTEDTISNANNLNEKNSKSSHSEVLINSAKELLHDWNNASQLNENDPINNNFSEFSNSTKSIVHDSNNLNQDNSNDSVTAHSIEFKSSVLGFTNDSNHANKDHGNVSVVVPSRDLIKSVNEVHNNISEDFKSLTINTSESKNDSHHPKATESTQEHLSLADSTGDLLKSTVASITNSKLFLNIHNSFMRLNPTEKPDSAKLKHVDETSENVRSVSDDLSTSKISEGNSNKPPSIDSNSREGHTLTIKEDIISNNAVADTSDTEDKVEFSTGNTDKILEDPTINNKSESFDRATEVVSAVESNASKGFFSSLGLDFLMNSELAKNAASAMDVFNFTDSALTDHIIDDQNDVHDLLDIRSSIVDDHNLSNSENSQHYNAKYDASDSSTSNTHSSTLVTGSSIIDTESSTLSMESSSVAGISDEVPEVNISLKETFAKENNSLSELSGRNGSIEALITSTTLNTTEKLPNVITVPTVLFNSNVTLEATTSTAQPDAINASDIAGEVKCPPPGICLFWFFAQDTCTINSHCLGSRICCRIGCSKTCVEV